MSDNHATVARQDDVLYDDFNSLSNALRQAADFIDAARDAGMPRPPLQATVAGRAGTREPFVDFRMNEYQPEVLAAYADWQGTEVREINHGLRMTRSFTVGLSGCRAQVGTQVSIPLGARR